MVEELAQCNSNAISEEATRRYYSTKQFLFTGIQMYFLSAFAKLDTKYFNPQNIWPIYSNQPLKDNLERYAKFPIATSLDIKSTSTIIS